MPQYRPTEGSPSTQPQLPSQIPGVPQASADEGQNASSLDDLIANASKQAEADAAAAAAATAASASANTIASASPAVPPAPVTAANTKEEAGEEKGAKKDKEKEKPKSTRLVYSDNETSPEEKMAMLAKYAFTPAQKTIVV